MKKNTVIIILVIASITLLVYAGVQQTDAKRFAQIAKENETLAERNAELARQVQAEARRLQQLAEQQAALARRELEECSKKKH